MIRVENLWKSFGRQEVLRGVSFEVQPGEFVALIGLQRLRQEPAAETPGRAAQTRLRPNLGRRQRRRGARQARIRVPAKPHRLCFPGRGACLIP